MPLYLRVCPRLQPDPESHFLLNHHHITIQYHATPSGNRVVGFYVQPVSVYHTYTDKWSDDDESRPILTSCPKDTGLDTTTNPMLITGPDSTKQVAVIWSYDVFWVPSTTSWAFRWDVYLNMGGAFSDDIHWFAIANAFIITLFLSGMVAMILVRALYKDLSRYNRVATDEEKAEDREETGWKLVHADVFRPPARRPQSFAVLIVRTVMMIVVRGCFMAVTFSPSQGVSTQVFLMAVFTIIFAAIGFLSPANRGALMIGECVMRACCMLLKGRHLARGMQLW